MKKLLFTIFSISIIFTPNALAISSANVDIHNNVNSSSNSTSQTTSHTDITVETNGKVTHYESDKPGDVSVKSENGESEIKVNGVSVSSAPKNTSPSSTDSNSPTMTSKPTPINEAKEIEEKTNQVENLIEEVKEKIDSIQSILSSLFD